VVAQDAALAKGVNVLGGNVVLREVAQSHAMPHTALADILA
jgi:alanine dehydrogenase